MRGEDPESLQRDAVEVNGLSYPAKQVLATATGWERTSMMVSTEASWSGPPVEANTAELQVALDGSLASWLRLLADADVHAEARS